MSKRLSITRIAAGVAAVLVCLALAHGARLELGPAASLNGYVVVPISVQGGSEEAVAGLQFDLNFDAANYALHEIILGPAADQAGKEALYTEAVAGVTRVLVVGMNQNVIPDGVVATLVLSPLGSHADAARIAVDNPIAADIFGNRLVVDIDKQVFVETADSVDDPPVADERNSTSGASPDGLPEVQSSSDGTTANETLPAGPDRRDGLVRGGRQSGLGGAVSPRQGTSAAGAPVFRPARRESDQATGPGVSRPTPVPSPMPPSTGNVVAPGRPTNPVSTGRSRMDESGKVALVLGGPALPDQTLGTRSNDNIPADDGETGRNSPETYERPLLISMILAVFAVIFLLRGSMIRWAARLGRSGR